MNLRGKKLGIIRNWMRCFSVVVSNSINDIFCLFDDDDVLLLKNLYNSYLQEKKLNII